MERGPDLPGYGTLGSGDGAATLNASPSTLPAHKRRVTAIACFICLVVVGEGYDIGVLNGALVRIRDELDISTWEASCVVTVTPIFFMVGSIMGSVIADTFGRRRAIMLCCCFTVVGPLGMAIAQTFLPLVAARSLVGFGLGVGFLVVTTYLAEISPADMRGWLISLEDISINLGILLGYLANFLLLGSPNDWRVMVALGSVLPMVVFCLLLFLPIVPESPRWLFSCGLENEAEKVLARFSGAEAARKDIKAMQLQAAESSNDTFATWVDLLRAWYCPGKRKMLMAGCSVMVAQMACGNLPVIYYSSTLLSKTMSERGAFFATAVLGVVKLATTTVALVIVDSVGRRPLLLASTGTTLVASAWLATIFALGASPYLASGGFALLLGGFGLGLGPIAFVYAAEVFTTKWRAKATGFAMFVSRIVAAGATFTFPVLVETAGASITFAIQAMICAALLLLIWCVVFETRGVPLEEMVKLYDSDA
jgi:sugar porter (SP) family MFS transporter